jgi:hypothetical protein
VTRDRVSLISDDRHTDLQVVDLRCVLTGWHTVGVPLPPWIIQELENERRQREEEERSRSSRIELPQTPAGAMEEGGPQRTGGVHILDISPRNDNVIDI